MNAARAPFRRRKAINITLSDRAKAIAAILADRRGTSISQLLDGMVLSELARTGQIEERDIEALTEDIRKKREGE